MTTSRFLAFSPVFLFRTFLPSHFLRLSKIGFCANMTRVCPPLLGGGRWTEHRGIGYSRLKIMNLSACRGEHPSKLGGSPAIILIREVVGHGLLAHLLQRIRGVLGSPKGHLTGERDSHRFSYRFVRSIFGFKRITPAAYPKRAFQY